MLFTVTKLVVTVVLVTLPFEYPLPGSIIRTSVTVPAACTTLTRPNAVVPVFKLAPIVPLVALTATQVGIAPSVALVGLPNAKACQLVELGIDCDVQLIPSGLVAHTLALCAIATNNP